MLAIDEAQDESHALQEGLLSNHAHAMQSRFKEFTVVVSVAQSLPRRPVLSIHINENEQYQFRFQYQYRFQYWFRFWYRFRYRYWYLYRYQY